MKMAAIRDRLHVIADDPRVRAYTDISKELHYLAEETRRRKGLRRSRGTPSKPVSPEMKKWIRTLRDNGLSYKEISEATGVYNHGRISEAVRGYKPG